MVLHFIVHIQRSEKNFQEFDVFLYYVNSGGQSQVTRFDGSNFLPY